jgi:hypothetical protein
MSAVRSKGSPAQLAVRRLHTDVLELTSAWPPLNTRLAALAQAAVNAHLQLGFAHSASMGALGQFSQLQDRLESKMYTNFQRQLDDIYATLVSMVRSSNMPLLSCFLCQAVKFNPHIVPRLSFQVDLVGSVFDSIHRFMDYLSSCPHDAHSTVFKASSLEDFGMIALRDHCRLQFVRPLDSQTFRLWLAY